MGGRRVYMETFGCQMNELDSELVAGQLRALGYEFGGSAEEADVVLYNTCSVREHAEQKVWSRLGELAAVKRRRPWMVVGALGCLAEREGEALIRRMPVVDVLCGPAELDKLPALLDNAVRTRSALLAEGQAVTREGQHRSARQVALDGGSSRRSGTLAAAGDRLEFLDLSRAVSPVDHAGSAYVRITRGCNKFCTYCVVPFTRGAEVHRPPEHIVDECRRLADAGVVEVTLLGQTVNHYRYEHGAMAVVDGVAQPQKGRTYKGGHGRDALAGERVTTFAGLLARIHEEVPAVRRLRFVTSYPRDFGDDVLEVMRDCPRICRYLHAPAQSGSDRILRLMNRGYTAGEYLEFLDRARAYLDEPEKGRPLSVAGDMIVGFCSETEEDHRASLELLERARYKNAFIFKYSPRPGTTAYDRLADDVPDEVKRRRNAEMLAVQGRMTRLALEGQVGREVEVLVEGVSERAQKRAEREAGGLVRLTVGGSAAGPMVAERGVEGRVQLTGRTEGDFIVHFDGEAGQIGRLVRVLITGAGEVSLAGRACE